MTFGSKVTIRKKQFIDQIICRNSVYKHLIFNKVSNNDVIAPLVAENDCFQVFSGRRFKCDSTTLSIENIGINEKIEIQECLDPQVMGSTLTSRFFRLAFLYRGQIRLSKSMSGSS